MNISTMFIHDSHSTIRKNRNRQKNKKKSTTVIHGGHSHRSLKTRKHFQKGRTQEGGGGGRAKRTFNKQKKESGTSKWNKLCKTCLNCERKADAARLFSLSKQTETQTKKV